MKILLAAGAGLFPYAVVVVFRLGDGFGVLPVVLGVGVLCAVAFLVLSRRQEWPARDTALAALSVKLLQIPAYALFFLLGLSGMVMIQFLAVTLIIWILDLITIALSGLLGLAAVLRCKKENILTGKQAVIYGVLQFVFCVDVISAVLLYRKTRGAAR